MSISLKMWIKLVKPPPSRPFGMRHLLCACIFVPLRFYTICFWKLKLKRLIFLINCRSSLTIKIVNRAKKMKNEWLTMPTLTKENVIFDFKLSPGWFSVAEEAEVDAHDWNQGNWKYLKIWSWKIVRFLWNMSFFQLVVTLCWLQFFLRKIQTLKIYEKHDICIGYYTSKSTSFPNSWYE